MKNIIINQTPGISSKARKLLPAMAALTAVVSLSSTATAATIFGNTADAELDGVGAQGNTTTDPLRVGQPGTSTGAGVRSGIFVFDLSTVTQNFATASLSLNYISNSQAGATTLTTAVVSSDLYLVGFSTTAAFPAAADFYRGVFNGDTTNTTGLAGLQNDFVTTTTATGIVTSVDFATTLNSLRPSGTAGNFAFFRLSADNAAALSNGNFYSFSSADTTGTTNDPLLTFTAIPEPSSALLLLGGMGLFLRRRR